MHEIVIAIGKIRLTMGNHSDAAVNKTERINKGSQMERNRSNFLILIVFLIADQVLSMSEKEDFVLGFGPVPFSFELQMRFSNDLVLLKMIESGFEKLSAPTAPN